MAWLPVLYAIIFPNIGGIANAFMIKNEVRDWYDKVGMSSHKYFFEANFS